MQCQMRLGTNRNHARCGDAKLGQSSMLAVPHLKCVHHGISCLQHKVHLVVVGILVLVVLKQTGEKAATGVRGVPTGEQIRRKCIGWQQQEQ